MARKRGHKEREAQDVKASPNAECKKSKQEEKEDNTVQIRINPAVNTSGNCNKKCSENNEGFSSPQEKTSKKVENESPSTRKNEISTTPGKTKLTNERDRVEDLKPASEANANENLTETSIDKIEDKTVTEKEPVPEKDLKLQPKNCGRPKKNNDGNSIDVEDNADPKSSKKLDNKTDEVTVHEREERSGEDEKPASRKDDRSPKKNIGNSIDVEGNVDPKSLKKSESEADDSDKTVHEKESNSIEEGKLAPRKRGRPKKNVEKSVVNEGNAVPKSRKTLDNETDDKPASEKELSPLEDGKPAPRKRGRPPKKNVENSVDVECKTAKKLTEKSNNETDDKTVTEKELGPMEESKSEPRKRGRPKKNIENSNEMEGDSGKKSNKEKEDNTVAEKEPVVMTLTLEHLREMRRSGQLATPSKVKGPESSKNDLGTTLGKEDSATENNSTPVIVTLDNLDQGRRSGRVRKLTDKAAAAQDNFKSKVRSKSPRLHVDQELHCEEKSEEYSQEDKVSSGHLSAKVQEKLRVRLQKDKDSSSIDNEDILSGHLSAKVPEKITVKLQKDKRSSSIENKNNSSSNLSAKVQEKVRVRLQKDNDSSSVENKNIPSGTLSAMVQEKVRERLQKGKDSLSSKADGSESQSQTVHSDHSFCKVDSHQTSQNESWTEDDIEGQEFEQIVENSGQFSIQRRKVSLPSPVSLHMNDHIKTVGNDQKLASSVTENNEETTIDENNEETYVNDNSEETIVSENNKETTIDENNEETFVAMEDTSNLDLSENVDALDLSKGASKETPPATTIDLNSMLTMAESDEKVLGGVSALIKDSLLQIHGMRQFVIHDLPSLTNITCFQTADKIAISGTIQGVNRAWSILTNIERNVHSKDLQHKKAVRIQWKTKNGLERAVEFKRVPESRQYKKSSDKFVKPVTVFVDVKTPVAVSDPTSDLENENNKTSMENVQNENGTSLTQKSPEPPKVSLLSGKPFSTSRIKIEGQVGIPVSKKQSDKSHSYASISTALSPSYKITVDKCVDRKTSTQDKPGKDGAKNREPSCEGKLDEVNQEQSHDDEVDDVDEENDEVEDVEEEEDEDRVIWEGKVETVDSQKYLCDRCSETFDSKNELFTHKFYMHEDDDGNVPSFVECDDCSQRFRCRLELHRHQRRAHSLVSLLPRSNKGSHVCNVCQKSFTEKRYLTTHLKRHAGIKNHKCDICGWRFFEAHKLKFHLETHKERSKRQLPYKCTICLRQYHNRQSWNDHMNTHTGSKPYRCQVCGSGFAHRIGLHRHKLIHEKNCQYKCTHCHRGFKVKANLTAHMTIHTGVGKHTCPLCQKVFTVATSLRRHRCQPPEPEVPAEGGSEETYMFMCGVCSITFPTLQEAETHSLAHVDAPTESVNLEGLQVEEVAGETDILTTSPNEARTTYYIQAQNTDGTLTTEAMALNAVTGFENTSAGFENTENVSVATPETVDEVAKIQMAASTLADLSTISTDIDFVAKSRPLNMNLSRDNINSTKMVSMTTSDLLPEGQALVVNQVAMVDHDETMEKVNPDHIAIATTNQDIVSMIATTGHDIVTMAMANSEAIMVTTQAQTSHD